MSNLIIVVSRDPFLQGVEGGFAQAEYRKKSPLQKLSKGDGIIYYASCKINGKNITWQKLK